ncbi:hypothetical protein D3C80_453360 [compost metagenome]
MGAHHRVLGVRVHRLERQAFFNRHGGTEARFDAVAGTQVGDLDLYVFRQVRIGLDHVGPHGVAAHWRAFHATQHAAHRRCFAPGGVGVPGVFIAVHRLVRILVDLHQPRMLRITAGHRMILQLAEAPGEGHVLGAGDVLITQEHHAVLEQLGTNLGKQTIVMHRVGQVDADQFGANAAGQLFDFHGWPLLKRRKSMSR